jgi:hypothetical protein
LKYQVKKANFVKKNEDLLSALSFPFKGGGEGGSALFLSCGHHHRVIYTQSGNGHFLGYMMVKLAQSVEVREMHSTPWRGCNHVKIHDWNVNKSASRLYINALKLE